MTGTFTLSSRRVEITNKKHPVTRHIEDFSTTDELYFRQQGDEPIEVLATARSSVTGEDEPMAWVYQYGPARVFQTVLGHAADSSLPAAKIRRKRPDPSWKRDPG